MAFTFTSTPFGGDDLFDFQNQFSSLVNDFFLNLGDTTGGPIEPTGDRSRRRRIGGISGIVIYPPVDVIDKDDSLVVVADLPGVPKDKVRVWFDGKRLYIEGETDQAKEVTEGQYRISERRAGRFQRSIVLPDNLKPEGVKARFHDGVLCVCVPKAAVKHESKPIPIEYGDDRPKIEGQSSEKEEHTTTESGKANK